MSTCKSDFLHNSSVCHLDCPNRSFALPGMMFCHPWLDCDANITIIYLISLSVVKAVYLANWNGYKVVVSALTSEAYEEDFLHNLSMLQLFSSNEHVVNFLGYCENSIVTEFHELGSALNSQYYLNNLFKTDDLKARLNLCISYASILAVFHNSVGGAYVMCDSNDLQKTLSQYLLTTDLRLVVNDLDASPKVDISEGGVRCGNRELTGAFIAPEQLWPYPEIEFNKNKMPFYDEKVDIFKIPDVCNWFLGRGSNVDVLKYKLHEIHRRCKIVEPSVRPSADEVVAAYKNVLYDLF